ncbi:MAG: phosphatase PAP2 family protein [candidate division KSB1 bacterium]|nr:phosphatase PAP2 family protein [candidate division KSB1 bacterium]MDZ7302044.1 phosphatase PAP2 family protein [candidate division KSB1 bacterium]MDZ7311086.1 phosphatase PAP2 family protein [candidate division KSB1 bacterium]
MNLRKLRFGLRLYDCLTLGYLWLTFLLVLFSPKPIPTRRLIFISHALASLLIVLLASVAQSDSSRVRWRGAYNVIQPVRDLYPFFLFVFLFFGEFTHLANLIFPYWIERYLICFDSWLFGQPAHQFIAQHAPAWAMELMAFAYCTYYPIIAMAALRHYLAPATGNEGRLVERHQVKPAFLDFMNRICLAFYLCYIFFMLMPARSPRHALNLQDQFHFSGGIFFNLISGLQNYVSVVGAAFPSSHVAVAWIALMTLRQSNRAIYSGLIPVVIALTVSVFILQYHYVLDAVFGVVIAWLLELYWRQRSAPESTLHDRGCRYASFTGVTENFSEAGGLRK